MKKVSVVAITALIAGFQILCYYMVNQICSTFPASKLYNLNTVIDDIIPYIGFTWIIYYSGDLFMLIWAFAVIWTCSEVSHWFFCFSFSGIII